MTPKTAKKVLLIGWDAADWKIINPLLDAGLMPTLEKLINRGSMGNIATLDPPLSPILWTSIGTGKTADKHGILNFVEPDADTNDIKPVSVTSRKVKAVWNILTQKGYKTHLVGWWPSHPAEPINGVAVSNMFHKPMGGDKAWEMPPGAIHPKELEHIFSECHIEPHEITSSMILPFVPNAAKVDQEKDKTLGKLASDIAGAASIHAAATWILENKEWDFCGVYLDSIDHFCHGFMKYFPPQMDGVPDEYFELYKDVINGAYRFHDMMLERLLNLAGDDATIILMSDHGFHSDHLRPKKLPNEPIAAALEHSPYGILCVAGPNIKKDERILGATLLDITPTILTLFNLPIGKDMDGKPLLQLFENKVTPTYIDSWELVEGECGMHPKNLQVDPWATQEAMKQLVELGYVEAPGENKQVRVKKITIEADMNLAKVLASNNKIPQAIEILKRLYNENPNEARFGLQLALCYQTIKNFKELRIIIDELKAKKLNNMPRIEYLDGIVLLAENKPKKALAALKSAESNIGHMYSLHISLGHVYLKIKKWEDAENSFRKALQIDINNAHASHGLGITLIRQEKYEEAIDSLLTAIGLLFYFPEAHYHLGEALYNIKQYERAIEAFNVAITMNPGYKKAHEWLIKIYEKHLHLPEKAEPIKKFIMEKIKGTIYVVSGLPRSGTSMMMQALKNGGLEILTDNLRKEDENNPKGYLEFEKTKKLAQDNSWINEANDKVIKVIAQLLQFLPDSFNYKIIFMEREMTEVLKSQQKMLGRDTSIYPTAIAETFSKQLETTKNWIKGQPNMEIMYVNYKEMIENPEQTAESISSFLDVDLDIQKMAESVDNKLYRNKSI